MSDKSIAAEYEVLTAEKERRREFLTSAATFMGVVAFAGFAGESSEAATLTQGSGSIPAYVIARFRLLHEAARSQDMDAAIKEYGGEARLTPQLTQRLGRVTRDELRAFNSICEKTGPISNEKTGPITQNDLFI